MSTEYRIKDINLEDFKSIEGVNVAVDGGITIIEFSSPFCHRENINRAIYNNHKNGNATLRRLGKNTSENEIRYLPFLIICIKGKGVISDDYGFEIGCPMESINNSYEDVTNRNKSFYDLDILDQYDNMLSKMSNNDKSLELDRFELSELTLENYLKINYPKMLVIKTRGYRTRKEELDVFMEHSSRYDGESINMQGECVTSKQELEFREKCTNEINEFWDGFNSIQHTKVMV